MSNEIGSALRDRLMEEVERLRAELADCRMQLDASCNAEELRQVRAERDALREDAERYRWLRSPSTLGRGMVHVWATGEGRYNVWHLNELDERIDAARRKP